ncbi:GspH/FimT family pseudopilin [uncultured Oceanisphaera sp.]|uniref:GspH/FimT family pseudopilin n=1 Tax=uncultured Oceanisphaera sp. TaxID=353858 RepID=UPI00262074E5|nr:GspH/FimT family pseudopilin [uncultured Oceanisphaera sp.]
MRIRTWSAGSSCHPDGFTLLELLVVLTLASLMLAVAMPRFAALLPGAELKSYSRQTAALLRLARSQAIATGDEVRVDLDPAARHSRMTGRQKVSLWPERITVSFNGLADNSDTGPVFYPDGSASGGTLHISGNGRHYQIEVNWLTGRISLHD